MEPSFIEIDPATALATQEESHAQEVAEIFSKLPEIEIIAIRRKLKSLDDRVFVLHPTTKSPVPIRLHDIERRDVLCQLAGRSSYAEIKDSLDGTKLAQHIRNESHSMPSQHKEATPSTADATDSQSDDYDEWADNEYDLPPPTEHNDDASTSVVLSNARQNATISSMNLCCHGSCLRRRYMLCGGIAVLLLLLLTVAVVAVILATGAALQTAADPSGNTTSGTSSTTQTSSSTLSTLTSHSTVPSTTPNPLPNSTNGCILLIGGSTTVGRPAFEFYHPEGKRCNIGDPSLLWLSDTLYTSGCYLKETQQIVVRETTEPGNKPSMLYGLQDQTAENLPLPGPAPASGSSAASVGETKCISCGGFASGALNNCYQYTSTTEKHQWQKLPASLPSGLFAAASVTVGDDHYVIGGSNKPADLSGLNKIYRYNVLDNLKWVPGPSMTGGGRTHHSAARFSENEFIVCGGYPTRDDCQVYNSGSGWRNVKYPLNIGRTRFSLVNFNNEIYAIGGQGGDTLYLRSVEKYERKTQSWTPARYNLTSGRWGFIAVVV